MKVAVNVDFGGFGVSRVVYDELGIKWDGYGELENSDFSIESDNRYAYRADPRLIAAIEKVGAKRANGIAASICIHEIADDTEFYINVSDPDEGRELLIKSTFGQTVTEQGA